jgi:hypothetical protein
LFSLSLETQPSEATSDPALLSFFERGIFVGQLRTRLGLPGWERKGPEEAARALLEWLG